MTPVNVISPELQNAQDTLMAVINRLNAVQTQSLQFEVQLLAANRRITELEAKIKELESTPETCAANEAGKAPTNGRDIDFEAVMQ